MRRSLKFGALLFFAAVWDGVAEPTGAGDTPPVLRIIGQAEVTGRDITGVQHLLGSGPFTLDLTVTFPGSTTSGTTQQTWSSAFSIAGLQAPSAAFPRDWSTNSNTITAGFEGEPDADFVNFGVFDCLGGNCSIPIGAIGNSEALGFEGMFGYFILPDGALGSEPFSTLGDFAAAADAVDFATATETLFNATWIPESLLPGAGSGVGEPDIRFLSVDGTISDVIYPAETQANLPGDFNANGVVDAADYTEWRDTLGTNFDLNGNGDETGGSAGVVDQADYDLWVANFGETAGSGAANLAPGDSPGANYAVPEPASIGLFALGLLSVLVYCGVPDRRAV